MHIGSRCSPQEIANALEDHSLHVYRRVRDRFGPGLAERRQWRFRRGQHSRCRGLSGTGQLLPPAVPEPRPFASLNRLVFDGDGNCEVTILANIGGTLIGPLVAENCTYTVDSDGFGRAVAELPVAP